MMQIKTYIPEMFKSNCIWCLWQKKTDKNGRATKVPMSVKYNGGAKSNDPSTWSDYEKAVSKYKSGNYDGLGIMLDPLLELVFIDIDHCIDTEGNIDARGTEVLQMFCGKTYIEVSQSDSGLHVMAVGSIPTSFKNTKANVEMYQSTIKADGNIDKGRFMAFTGRAVSPCEPSRMQDEIDAIYQKYLPQSKKKSSVPSVSASRTASSMADSEIIQLAKSSKNGKKFSDLYNGNWQQYYKSQSEADCGFCSMLAFWCGGDMIQMDSIFRTSGLMRDKWDTKRGDSTYGKDTIYNACQMCTEYYKPRQTTEKKAVASVRISEKMPLIDKDIYTSLEALKPFENPKYNSMDDLSNGRLFADIFKDKARYNASQKLWNTYNGKCWTTDTENLATRNLAKKLVDALVVYSLTFDGKQGEAIQKYVFQLRQMRRRETMINDARDFYPISREMLDSNVDLFNCQNCVLNIKTFEVLEHDPNLLQSKIANAEYIPDARSPLFEKYFDEIMLSNEAKKKYIQRVLGLSLTTLTEEEMYIWYGSTTRNGKSTLAETIAYMMGDYAMNCEPETFAIKDKSAAAQSSDIARLHGARMVRTSEPQKRMQLSANEIKKLTGRDTKTARYLFENPFEFVPYFKLFMLANDLPIINDDSVFSGRRIKVITFDKHFEPEEEDHTLKDRLQSSENISGILNWCLDGLKDYYSHHGTDAPQEVIASTDAYRQNSDKIGNFLAECVEVKEGCNISLNTLYKRFETWCNDSGYYTDSKSSIKSELQKRNLLYPTGTVGGVTTHNVIRNRVLKDEGFIKSDIDWS